MSRHESIHDSPEWQELNRRLVAAAEASAKCWTEMAKYRYRNGIPRQASICDICRSLMWDEGVKKDRWGRELCSRCEERMEIVEKELSDVR